MAMTHPHPPICLFREKLPGGFRAHVQGPSHAEAEAWAPVGGRGSQHILQDAVLLRDKQPPALAEGSGGARLGSAAQRMEFLSFSRSAWSCCWQS